MKKCVLCAVDNCSIVGMDHCFGAPFIAKDFEQAKEMVVKAVEQDKNNLDLSKFFLVELCSYDLTCGFPLDLNSAETSEEVCVAELFEIEENLGIGENSGDEVAYCGRYHGVSGEQVGEESEVADE